MIRVVEHWQGSDLGRQRQGNEDNYFVRVPLFVVADGMGGAQAGEVASEMAVTTFEGGLPDGVDPGEALSELIERANTAIHDRSRSDADQARSHEYPPLIRGSIEQRPSIRTPSEHGSVVPRDVEMHIAERRAAEVRR